MPDSVGPGSVEETGIDPKPLLDGATEFEYVGVHNPLQVDFKGRYAVTRIVDTPVSIPKTPNVSQITQDANDVRQNYGLDLKNPDHSGRVHIQNTVEIKAGETVRLLGDAAQVIVRQLVNVIIQADGRTAKLFLADAHKRHEVEQTVVKSRGLVSELLGRDPVSVKEQLADAVTHEETPEDEFPEVPKRGRGRPRKNPEVTPTPDPHSQTGTLGASEAV